MPNSSRRAAIKSAIAALATAGLGRAPAASATAPESSARQQSSREYRRSHDLRRCIHHKPDDPCRRCGGSEFRTVWPVAPYAIKCIYCKLDVLPAHRKVLWPDTPP